MKSNEPGDLWLTSVVGRFCIFVYGMSIIVMFLYVVGNSQEFADTTQYRILEIYQALALLFLVAGVYYLAIRIYKGVRRGSWSWRAFILTIVALLQTGVFLALVKGLVVVSLGTD